MKNPFPYVCDECSEPKKPSNGWLLGMPVITLESDELPLKRSNDANDVNGFAVTKWSDKLAEHPVAAHLCGIPCAAKWTARKLDERFNSPQPAPAA
jgi:hypothetical protein